MTQSRSRRRPPIIATALAGVAVLLVAVGGGAAPAAAAGSTAAVRHAPDSALRSALQGVVDAGATGALAVVDDGRHRDRVAVGLARLSQPHELEVVDQTRVGSITKTFMSTITLQLAGERRLRLDDSVERWLPGVVPNGRAITLRMLLNHTSGIFNYTDDLTFVNQVLADPTRIWTPQELLAVAFAHPPVFAPGASWSYSNTNYILVGLVLQKVTGTSVQDLVRGRITRPLHLEDTYLATSARFRGPHAHGYLPPSLTGDGYLDTTDWSPSWAWAAGAMVSNAADLARFYRALLGGRLLAPRLLDEMTTTVDVAPGLGYGLGLFFQDTPCGTIWGHDGSIPGYLSFSFTDRTATRSAVLLVPTQPDSQMFAAAQQALLVAICQMFDRPVPEAVGAGSGAAALADGVLAMARHDGLTAAIAKPAR